MTNDKPKRKFNPNWPSARKDVESGSGAARMAAQRKLFAEATGYASPAKLVKAIESSGAGVVRNGEMIGDHLVWIDNGTIKLIEK